MLCKSVHHGDLILTTIICTIFVATNFIVFKLLLTLCDQTMGGHYSVNTAVCVERYRSWLLLICADFCCMAAAPTFMHGCVTAHNDGPKWSFLDVENGRRRGLDETR